MTREGQLAFQAAIDGTIEALDSGDEEFHASIPASYDVKEAERFTRMIRTTGFEYTLRTLRRAPVSVSRRVASRSRERRSSAGRRRSTSTTRDDGSDSDGPGDAGPQRRRVVVDDHYLVVALVT